MQTVVFPHTDLDTETARLLRGWFGPILLMAPLGASEEQRRLEADGILRILHPHPELDTSVADALDAATSWASTLSEKDLRYFRSGNRALPYRSGGPVSSIRDAIRSRAAGKEANPDSDGFRAKMVLGLARELDRQRDDLQAGLRSIASSENELQRWLSNGITTRSPSGTPSDLESLPDPLALKHMEQVRAWSILALEGLQGLEATPILLLTGDAMVFEEMIERLAAEETAVRRAPLFQDEAVPEPPFGDTALGPSDPDKGTPKAVLRLFQSGCATLPEALKRMIGSTDTDPAEGGDIWVGYWVLSSNKEELEK